MLLNETYSGCISHFVNWRGYDHAIYFASDRHIRAFICYIMKVSIENKQHRVYAVTEFSGGRSSKSGRSLLVVQHATS